MALTHAQWLNPFYRGQVLKAIADAVKPHLPPGAAFALIVAAGKDEKSADQVAYVTNLEPKDGIALLDELKESLKEAR